MNLNPAPVPPQQLELFHAASSYYSMVARLALAEAHLPWTSRLLDIHLAKQQLSEAYRLLNQGMTVPTLRGADWLLTDSAEILAFAAAQAGPMWADDDPGLRDGIAAVVQGHYAISIETLTFSKLLATSPGLRPLVACLLSGLSRDLDRRAARTKRDPASLRAKAEQDRQRLHTFTQRPASETLAAMRVQVQDFLTALPPVAPQQWLFGPRISRADVVLAVLMARLSMVDEGGLVQRDDLRQWWSRYQQRPSFAGAEIWTRFRRRRFLQAVLSARWTPIRSNGV